MAEPRWLTADQMRSWLRLQAVVELLPGILDQQLQHDAQLTHYEYLTLAMLSESEDRSLPMSALARRTNATLPRLSHVVRRLEERGYVRRSPAPDDGRVTVAALTEAGWEKVVASAPGHARNVLEHVYDQLDDADVADLVRVLGKIVRGIDPADRFGSLAEEHPAIPAESPRA
ncbi:MarR family winged helix-turn-helix transcriptional regulator [Luteimicrobium sp. DT211]|uniref:MarR family winged helix-turn-helix transcriptional regulator n=1 Tax=Luteimicrobium sp. DT211 TaxID=3393412 RepID=UPI003CE90C43